MSNNEPYELMPGYPGWIKVCAWCYPGEKIFDLFPDMRGQVEISHGICKAHYEQKMTGILRRCDVIETIMPDGYTQPINIQLLKG